MSNDEKENRLEHSALKSRNHALDRLEVLTLRLDIMLKLDQIIRTLKDNRKVILITIASIIVAITTYLLVMPAFTLDEKKAEEQGGIEIEEVSNELSSDGNEAETPEKEPDGTEFYSEKNEETDDTEEEQNEDGSTEEDKPVADVKSDYSIRSKGESYEVEVSYGDNAGIPDDAELKVEEILPDDAEYKDYYDRSIKKINKEEGITEDKSEDKATKYARLFDISIYSKGEKVEPQENVSVNIKLTDVPKKEMDNLKVVHFAEKGTELIEYEVEEKNKKGEADLTFETDGFSVYSIVSVPGDAYNIGRTIDGKSFAMYASDPENSSVLRAMVSRISNNGFDAQAVTVENNTIVGGIATLWTFENTDGHTGTHYRIYCTDDSGNKRYIRMTGQQWKDDASLTGNANDATVFNIENSNGKIALKYDEDQWGNGRYITNQNVGGWEHGKRVFRGKWNTHDGNAGLFTLASLSDQYDEYKATKISAANLQENKEIVIYRKDNNGNLYALADDGSFVPITESGESVYWRTIAGNKNILWKMSITSSTSGYYDFTSVADPSIHISPSINDHTVMDDKYIGVTLDGRQNKTYTSTIKAWDDPHYSWVGITHNGETSEPVYGVGDSFMFAEYSSFTTDKTQEVDTVDSATLGIKIRMFDYSGSSYNTWGSTDANENNRLYGMTYAVEGKWSKEDGYIQNETPNLVGRTLNDKGLPVSSGDMSWLFEEGDKTYSGDNNTKTFVKDDKGETNHLFIKSIYDETGYFHYSSAENYAYLPNGSSDFKVYQQVASPNTDPRNDHWYFYHGHFMPYNNIDMSKTYDNIRYEQSNATAKDSSDPRTYEPVYGTVKDPSINNNDGNNFFTGMSMEADFAQLEDGLDKNGNPVIFKFTGDDDMWVFIDGVRVLDLGGIHEALSGTINFATGEVNVNGDTSHDLYWFYNQAGKADTVKWKDGPSGHKIFADFTTHEFKMFYMERGAGASNLDLHFNLPVVKAGSFTVAKKLTEPAQSKYSDVKFAYRAYLDDGTVLKPGVSKFESITYEGTSKQVEIDQNGVFYLKPGEAATIQLKSKDTKYYVEELGVDTELYKHVDIVEDPGSVTQIDSATYSNYPLGNEYKGDTFKVYRSTSETIKDRSRVTYENTPSSKNLNDLHITKKVVDGNGKVIHPDDSATFEFKVFFEGTDGALMPYMQSDYYLTKKGSDGFDHYYDITSEGLTHVGYLDGSTFHAETSYVWYNTDVDSNGKKIPHRVNAGDTVSVGEERYELPVCGVSGQNGSVSKIPEGYTVVIKDLLAGTEFYVEERLASPRYYPVDYEYVGKEVVEGTADEGTLPTDAIKDNDNQPTAIADGSLKVNTDGKVIVTNRLPIEDIKVKKVWSDDDKVDHSEDYITYKLYRIPTSVADPTKEFMQEEITETAGFTGRLNDGNDWEETMAKLPQYGFVEEEDSVTHEKVQTKVKYQYYVSEDEYHLADEASSGYRASTKASVDQEGTKIITITNTPSSSYDKPTSVEIVKEWQDASGNPEQDAHDNDTITVSLKQKKYNAKITYTSASGSPVTSNIYPVKVTLINENKSVSPHSTTLYVPSGQEINITADSDGSGKVRGNGFTYNGEYHAPHTYTISGVTAAKEVTLTLTKKRDTWGTRKSRSTWTITAGNRTNTVFTEEQMMSRLNIGGDPISERMFNYTMELNSSKDDTVITRLESALGVCEGNGKWDGIISELPFFERETNSTFYFYKYEVSEIRIGTDNVVPTTATDSTGAKYDGETSKYLVKWSESSGTTTITNRKKPNIDITVKKVDVENLSEPDPELLTGATFSLTKYTNSSFNEIDSSWTAQTVLDTQSTGTFSFTGLSEGYYVLDETKTPIGYVKTFDAIRLKVEDQKLYLLDNQGSVISGGTDGTVRVENTTASTAYVGNTPGAELPMSGGCGTHLIYLLGAVLAIGCAVMLIARKRCE